MLNAKWQDTEMKNRIQTSGCCYHLLGALLPAGGGVDHVGPGVPGQPRLEARQLAAARVYHHRPRLHTRLIVSHI